MKVLTRKEIIKANKHNPCFLLVCSNCGYDVIEETIKKSKKYNTDAYVSSCPHCNYSFTN